MNYWGSIYFIRGVTFSYEIGTGGVHIPYKICTGEYFLHRFHMTPVVVGRDCGPGSWAGDRGPGARGWGQGSWAGDLGLRAGCWGPGAGHRGLGAGGRGLRRRPGQCGGRAESAGEYTAVMRVENASHLRQSVPFWS